MTRTKGYIMTKNELYALALEATKFSYSPYSNFKVGAALIAENGEIFTGCNVENASYGGTICAERTAVLKAVSSGQTSFKKIAIAESNDGDCTPCGICRQFLSEFSKDGSLIVICKSGGILKEFTLQELLPNSFTF
jgi:cytidine deaminase